VSLAESQNRLNSPEVPRVFLDQAIEYTASSLVGSRRKEVQTLSVQGESPQTGSLRSARRILGRSP